MNINLRMKSPLALLIGLLFLLPISSFYAAEQDTASAVVYEKEGISVSVPECQLLNGSLAVSTQPPEPLIKWSEQQQTRSYHFLEHITQLWKNNSIQDFLIYGHQWEEKPFHWEIVPFLSDDNAFLTQLSLIWRIVNGGTCLSHEEQLHQAADYRSFAKHFGTSYKPPETTPNLSRVFEKDPFSNPKVIEKQQIYEGKSVRLLYNYAPIEELSFLLVTKEPKTNFTELTLDEYLEAQSIATKLIAYYQSKGFPSAYLFHKKGEKAGQTVNHWHEHLIFMNTADLSYWEAAKLYKELILGASVLSDDDLAAKVSALKKDLLPLFEK